jgi:large subunit ribosomal protein L10
MRKEKQLLLDEIQEKVERSQAMIIASYKALPPNNAWELREQLAKAGGSVLEVVRKRVFLKAAEKAGVKLNEELLKGHVGVVFVPQSDALAAAKVVFKYSEENGDALEVVGGQIDGAFVAGPEVALLAKLPSLNELRSQILALFVSPMSQTLAVVEAAIAAKQESGAAQS